MTFASLGASICVVLGCRSLHLDDLYARQQVAALRYTLQSYWEKSTEKNLRVQEKTEEYPKKEEYRKKWQFNGENWHFYWNLHVRRFSINLENLGCDAMSLAEYLY